MERINKVGAVILKGKKFMVVRERGDDSYITPGGRPEAGESPIETLKRELKEELNADVKSFSEIGILEGLATKKNAIVVQHLFLTEIEGDIKPCSEIEDIKWVGVKSSKIRLSPFITNILKPKLQELSLVK